MKLHENKRLFRQAIQVTADQMQIAAIYVEKDYWITYALYTIFNDPIGNDTVFKGGTALSKCYNMIERFSEDIDIVMLRRDQESSSQLTKKIRKISEVVGNVMPEVGVEGLTQKMGMNRKTAHTYNKEFDGQYGQVRDVIVVEATWLGYYEPYTTRNLVSYVCQMMLNNKQEKIADEYGLLPFEVRVLEPTRTICEKIMSLVRFSYAENPIDALKRKIRHTYDLHQLLQQPEFLQFFDSPDFEDMLVKVGNDDVASFKNNNQWLANHPIEALIFKDTAAAWEELRNAYNGDFKNLVYGNLPKDSLVRETLEKIGERTSSIDWDIKLDTSSSQ